MKYIKTFEYYLQRDAIYGSYTKEIKFDRLYEDDKWSIFVPHNPYTSTEMCGKDTQWCTNNHMGWDIWVRDLDSVLYRFISKDGKVKLKLTWRKEGNYSWAFGYNKSNFHLSGKGDNPFRISDKDYIDIEELKKKEDRADMRDDEYQEYLKTLALNAGFQNRKIKLHNEIVSIIRELPLEALQSVFNYQKYIKTDHMEKI